jgi:hypothetical protein
MIKEFIFRQLVKWYIREVAKIVKLKPEQEFMMYSFDTPEDVIKLLKALETAQVTKYWTARKEDQDLVRGMGAIPKIMLDAHKLTERIKKISKNPKRRIELWEAAKQKINIY